jgi:mono/diheme cytochrome c family protein
MVKKVLKWVGIVLASLVGLLGLVFVILLVVGGAKANKKYEVPVVTVSVPTDAVAIQRGEHIATIFICKSCHTENLGGELYFDVPGLVSIPTPNLTSGAGGVGNFYTNEDWVRAIRHGAGQDGKALFIMPSNIFYYLSGEDLGALIGYLKSLPPVDNVLPERRIELLGRLMMAVGMFSRTCTMCHGVDLNGAPFGPPGQEVPTPNLTPGGELVAWSEQDFFTTLRTGVTPGGRQLDERMPWKFFGQMTDEELRAVWQYLQSLPALEQNE